MGGAGLATGGGSVGGVITGTAPGVDTAVSTRSRRHHMNVGTTKTALSANLLVVVARKTGIAEIQLTNRAA